MTVTITESAPFERIVRFPLTDDEINAAKAGAARKLADELKVSGFRRGKAPLPVVEATVGADRVRREAIELLLPAALRDVLGEEEIIPAIAPELTSLDEVDGGVEVEVTVTLWPEIDLPNYRDRTVEVADPACSEDMLQAELAAMRMGHATVEEVERAAETGDYVSISVEATRGGEPVEAVKAEDLLVDTGAGDYIEGINAALKGAEAGDEIELVAHLPEWLEDESGGEALVKVKVNEVKELVLPDLDDEWVDENTEFETVDELSEYVRESQTRAQLHEAAREYAEKALSTLRDQVDVELPEALVRAEMDNRLHNLTHRLDEAEATLDDYLRSTGFTPDELIAAIERQAETALRNQLVLEAVAEAEEIEVTEEDLTSALGALAAESGDPAAFIDEYREAGVPRAVARAILRDKAMGAILSNAQPVDEDGNLLDLSLHTPEVEADVVDAESEIEAAMDESMEAELAAERAAEMGEGQ